MKHTKEGHTPKELLSELKALVAEAEAVMGDAAAADESGELLGGVRARFEAAQERFSEIYDGARRKVVDSAKYTDTAIRENPYQALAIAAGVGVLVGVLVGRRNNQ
ncbi:MAG: hypothetical protein JWM88_2814 [Verrucomicrobia bacterium]|nr:hypothetical protein [Verrucomicrobiota bacterium]